jgi:hypothetical protein
LYCILLTTLEFYCQVSDTGSVGWASSFSGENARWYLF